jgi:hypothetical protein
MSNYIIREDNRLNIEIAKSSQKIAEQARTDNMLNLRLAKATARVAEETRQDSSAMKTLALVTLTFLPATAVAVSPSHPTHLPYTPNSILTRCI